MKRRPLLIAACLFAAVSLGLNIWLIAIRNAKPPDPAPAEPGLPPDVSAAPVLQPLTMDFSGTAFADDSWKLTDERDPSISLETPFKWDDLNPLPFRRDADPPARSVSSRETSDSAAPVTGDSADAPRPTRAKTPDSAFEFWRTWTFEVPPYLDDPLPDPNNVRNKGLYTQPPPR